MSGWASPPSSRYVRAAVLGTAVAFGVVSGAVVIVATYGRGLLDRYVAGVSMSPSKE